MLILIGAKATEIGARALGDYRIGASTVEVRLIVVSGERLDGLDLNATAILNGEKVLSLGVRALPINGVSTLVLFEKAIILGRKRLHLNATAVLMGGEVLELGESARSLDAEVVVLGAKVLERSSSDHKLKEKLLVLVAKILDLSAKSLTVVMFHPKVSDTLDQVALVITANNLMDKV
jgi:hypothetical protein